MEIRKVRVLLFDDVELLDFAGPMEVWSVVDYLVDEQKSIDVKTIASQNVISVSKSELQINPQIVDVDENIDILIIPGGFGTRPILKSEAHLEFIKALIKNSKVVCSVCTGALVLGKLGLLKDLHVTTHHLLLKDLQELSPSSKVDGNMRFIDQGCIITAAGVSAGIDMSLYLVAKYFNSELMNNVAEYIEYPIRNK